VEYVNRQDGFAITFPAQPTMTTTTYKSEFGAVLPARVYSVTDGGRLFSVTVVDYANIEPILIEKAKSCPPGAETCRGNLPGSNGAAGQGYSKADFYGAVIHATYRFLQRDAKLTYLGWNSANLVEGQVLSMTNADRSRTSAGIYMHEQKLYIIEGTVPEGHPEPTFFQQSVGWIDANGNGIRYQSMYHHGYPKPQSGRGGQ
jgi:hypothetical protein